MKFKLRYVVFLFFVAIINAFGQVTIVSDGLNNSTTLFTLSGGGAYFTGNSGASDGVANASFASEGTHSRGVVNATNTLTTTANVNTSSYSGVSMTMRLASFSLGSATNGADVGDTVSVEVSPDGGTTYYPTVSVSGNSDAYWSYATGTGVASTPYDGNATIVDFRPPAGGSRTTDGYSTITVTNLPSTTTLKVRIIMSNNFAPEQWVIDDFKITGTLIVTTANNGDWYTGSTWVGGIVPTNAQSVVIAHNVTNVVGAAPITRDSGTITTINSGVSLSTGAFTYTNNGTTNVNGTFQIENGGYAAGNNFVYNAATGTLNFNTTGNYNISNTDVYWPVGANKPFNVNVLQGGITLASNASRIVDGLFTTANGGIFGVAVTSPATLTLNGTCRINTGGNFQPGVAPIYGNASTLNYNSGGTFGRGVEWNALGVGTIGVTQGYPNNVQLSNNTTLNYTNGTPLAKAMNGNLTVDAGSSFYMDFGSVTAGGFLTVSGNVNVAGNLSLGFVAGDDLKIGGNLTFTGSGNLTSNNRAVFFIKNGTQTISSALALTIPYIVFQPASGSTTIQLLSNLIVSSGIAGGNAISFSSASDIFDINGNTLTIGTASLSNTIFGAGTFKGSSTSNLTLLGNGSIGTLNFTTGFQNLGTFVMNRQATIIGCVMGTTVTINTTLTLTNGLIDLGNNFITLAAAATTTGGSANSYVIADVANGANASLRKTFTAAGSFTYPIGDGTASANGSQYSPATILFSAGTYGGYAGVAVDDVKNPNLDASVDFITRYWALNISGIAPTSYAVSANYFATDVNGTEANCKSNQWNGSVWSNGGTNAGTNTLNIGGITTVPAINHITKGYRDAEINVVQGVTNYLHTSTYDFGTVDTGTLNNVVFTVQNTGDRPLTLPGVNTLTGNPPYSFFAALTTGNLAGLGTRNFTIRFAPTTAGTFSGSVTIPNGDTTGSEAPYVINFTGIAVLPAPEINVKGIVGANPTITSGDVTPSGTDNTLFASTVIGSNQVKSFRIENIGTANLVIPSITNVGGNSGDFIITATIPPFIAFPAGTFDFTIAFTPTSVGVRSTTLTIAHNDPDDAVELPTYNFLIQGTATCPATANTITPTSGPVGTEVTINATSNNLTGASVTFNGIPAVTITYISSTQIKVIVPSGATSGNLITTNANGCTASNIFTVITNLNTACEGATTNFTDIIISELYDTQAGSSGVVELYNPTLNPINLVTNDYRLARFTDSGSPITVLDLVGTIPARSTYLIAADNTSTSCTGLTLSEVLGTGFNENDRIELRKFGTTAIDAVIGPNEVGYSVKRLTTATGPTPTFAAGDWTFSSSENCADLGIFDLIGSLPTVTLQPVFIPSCKSTTITIAGAEGFVGGLGLTYQWFGVAPNVSTWTTLTNAGIYSGVNTTTLTISNLAGLDNYQFYCQIRENTTSCYVATNAIKIIEAQTVTWNGSSWTPSVPTISKIAVINGNYDTTANGNIDACSLIVNNGFTATITSNNYINIENDLKNNGSLVINNNGSLVQINDSGINSGTGSFTMNRDVNIRKYDYVYWSSPVNNFPVTSISPTTLTNHIFKWNPTQSGSFGNWVNTTENMVRGKGYIVRGPNAYTTILQNYTASFTASGASGSYPFNGNFTTPIERGNHTGANYANPNPLITNPVTRFDDNLNLIGNPYPSSIKSLDFLNNNANIEGAIYLWTHGTLPATGVTNPFYQSFTYNYTAADYIIYNGTGTVSGPTGFNGNIASGQGFFVTMIDGAASAQTVSFNNALRNKTYANNQFYRIKNNVSDEVNEDTKSRIWLDLVSSEGIVRRTLVGYIEGATIEKDRIYDTTIRLDGGQNLYSLINNERMVIQGKPLPFLNSDTIPLGFQSATQNTYNLAIVATDGLFESDSQPIFLEDKLLNIIFNLRQAPYVFSSEVGNFDNRFVLRFTNQTLSNDDIKNANKNITLSIKNNVIDVKSYVENISKIVVYDVLGRKIYSNDNVKNKEYSISEIIKNNQALIVKITLENGQVVSKKILF